MSAATITFTANSINFCFLILGIFNFCLGLTRIFTEYFIVSQKSQKYIRHSVSFRVHPMLLTPQTAVAVVGNVLASFQ